MKKKFDVISIGGANLDIMFSTNQAKIIKNRRRFGSKFLMAFDLGSKIVSQDVIYTNGGGAANSSVSFARLGFKTAVFTIIGQGASGQQIINRFKKEGVETSLIHKSPGFTGLSFVITGGKKSDRVIFAHRSVNDLMEVKPTAFRNITSKWLYLSSLSGKHWKKNLKNIFESMQKKKIKMAWNPGGSQLSAGYPILKKYFSKTEVLIVNKEEAMQLVASYGVKTSRIPKLFKIMHSWGPKIIAITQGEKGAFVCSGETVCYNKALPATGVNTTGAGDAFGSSFVSGLMMYKGDLKKALKLAIIRSNYVVREVGAQEGLPTLAQIKKFKI